MPEIGIPTIDQLRVFLTVIDAGSFAAGGRKLKRATSAVSYTISNLEFQLGMKCFDRERTRKPTLTPAGVALMSEARTVLKSIDNLRAVARGLISGLEAEVIIAVDVFLPTERLVDTMRAFELAFPTVALRLHVEALGAVTQLVHTGAAHIGIGGGLHTNVPDIERVGIGGVELVPVAAPSHPLARNVRGLTGAARDYVQLVLTDRSQLTKGQDFGVIGDRTWRLADLGAKHSLLLPGIGWGNMPKPMVSDDIDHGRLKALHVPELSGAYYDLQAIHRTDLPPGPAATWVIERFRSQNQLSQATHRALG
jgi:DNA-binding transcriptional LysR family regulator